MKGCRCVRGKDHRRDEATMPERDHMARAVAPFFVPYNLQPHRMADQPHITCNQAGEEKAPKAGFHERFEHEEGVPFLVDRCWRRARGRLG